MYTVAFDNFVAIYKGNVFSKETLPLKNIKI